jgi:hypothetical protein
VPNSSKDAERTGDSENLALVYQKTFTHKKSYTSTKTTLASAFAEAEQKVAGLQTALAAALDAAQRGETATEIAAMRLEIQAVARDFDAIIDRMRLIFAAAAVSVPEANGVVAYCLASQNPTP